MKDEITILYTFWDTDENLWRRSFTSACQLGLDIIIIDDQSSEIYKKILEDTVDEYQKKYTDIRIKIFTPLEKLQQEGATYFGAQRVRTDYIIRMDSDDIILGLPTLDLSDNFDIYNAGPKRCSNLYDWLRGYNGSINGSIIKKEILEFMYEDHEYMAKYHNYWHEDNFTSLKLFLMKNPLIKKVKSVSYKQVLTKEHSKKLRINKRVKRLETLLAVCLRYNIDPVSYYKYSKYLWENVK